MMKILITGGCGFIGVNLVKFLSERDLVVRVVDNLSVGKKEYLEILPLSQFPELIVEDVRNKKAMDEALDGVDAVVHLAAHTSVMESLGNPTEDWDINVNGTFNLLEACRQSEVDRFVFASSNAAVGEQEPPIDETKVPQPLSPYGASKLAGEALCSTYYHSFGLKTVALRFANSYGPHSAHKASVIPLFMKLTGEKRPIIIYGDGNQTRDFVHVDDVCRAIHLALTDTLQTETSPSPRLPADGLYGGVLQVGTGIETSINKLAELLKEVSGEKIQIVHEAERGGEIKKNYSDITKARRLLGFEPKITLKEGLHDLWRRLGSKAEIIR
jgi:UDP-glucose 4-epimerase